MSETTARWRAEAQRIADEAILSVERHKWPGVLDGALVPITDELRDAILALCATVEQATREEMRQDGRDLMVRRFEVIDHRMGTETPGRVLVCNPVEVNLSWQDGDRTLKVFLTGPIAQAGAIPAAGEERAK